MAEFIEAIRLKFDTDLESALKNALAARYSLDEMIEIIYLHRKYTADRFIDEESFKASGIFLGIKAIVGEMHVIRLQFERFLRERNEDKGAEDSAREN